MNPAITILSTVCIRECKRVLTGATRLATAFALSLLAIFLVALSPFAYAGEKTEQAQHAVYLFEEACFKNLSQPEKIRGWARSAALHELAPDAARKFLKRSGMAWNAANSSGDYVVAVGDEGLCSVFAREADATTLKALVKELLPKPPFVVTPIPSERKVHPYGEVETMGYLIAKPDMAAMATLIVSTSESGGAPIQGMISMFAGRKNAKQGLLSDDTNTREGVDKWYVASELDQQPKPLSVVMPRYPVEARQKQTEGEVKLSLKIDEKGEIKDVAVIEAQPMGVFDGAALVAFKDVRFSPAIRRGEPVRANILILLKFRMDETPAAPSGDSARP